ncbi:ATP-binding protein [Paludicola sp. MB14-C6]|uniref:sensor histidine kinase n=1 Tax=Paludihabitans sp. MB14-C6 TaxID=3070656 RepID=UPI0027DCADA3|nr:ATP-binding protein [Paludicola sp. MB14-C6]WMJ22538.1 ATP-binding protein [Paludicola sp. MB14-C6]
MGKNEYAILDNQNTPIFICNTNFTVIYINNFIKNNAINIKCGDSLHNYSALNAKLLSNASDELKKGTPFHCETFILNYIDYPIHFIPVQSEQNKTEKIVCYLEYNKKTKITQQLDHSSLYGALQGPAVRILNLLPPIAQKLTQLEEYDDLKPLNHIAKNSYQILRKSAEVSNYYNLINNKIKFNLSYHIINNYLENLVKALQLLLLNSGYKLTYEICPQNVICLFDEEYLSIALFHIISNSCIFSPKESTIHISLKTNNDFVSITITDESIGIPQKKMDRIFRPFYSAIDSNKALEQESIGLGLPITKKIVEAFNGKLFITSEVNKGTTVVLALPIANESEIPLTIKSDNNRYITNRLSNMYIYFSNICDISLF